MKIEKLLWLGAGLLLLGCRWLLFGPLNGNNRYIVAVVGNALYAEKTREFGRVAAVKQYEDNSRAFNAVVGGRVELPLLPGLPTAGEPAQMKYLN